MEELLSAWSTKAKSTGRASRFTPKGRASETVEDVVRDGKVTTVVGSVYCATDRAERAYLVHTVGTADVAVPLHAVATAITGAVISPDLVARVFAETGKLDTLMAALSAYMPDPPEVSVADQLADAKRAVKRLTDALTAEQRNAAELAAAGKVAGK